MASQLLIEQLALLKEKSNQQWLADLEPRKLRELEFHNMHRDQSKMEDIPQDTYEKLYGNKRFYGTVELSSKYVQNWIKINSPNKVVLDYACGNGVNAIAAARAGADLVIGIDISDISIQNARVFSEQQGASQNTFFVQADCENTELPDKSIDVIICSGMLHHLDLSYALFELRRILKPGGVVLAVEALDYNPLIKLYRNRTPAMRTEWEKLHILSYKDLTFASRFFEIKNIKHWHLLSIAGVWVPHILTLLNAVDKIILNIPFIKMWSWMFTFEMHKRQEI